MPDSVKISDLVPRAALGTDVLPAVDSTFTSTIRVSASSIAALGGGPPGDGTVTTAKLANGAVTLAKLQSVSARRLLGNSTASSGPVGEVEATEWGLNILKGASYAAIRSLLDTSTAFTGQITFGKGTAGTPSIACNDPTQTPAFVNTNTGIYWPDTNTVGISTEGTLKFYIDGEGTQYSNIAEQFTGSPAVPLIRPQYACRAWVAFNGSASTTTIIKSQSTIAQRYGLTGSLYNDGWTDTSGTQTAGTPTGLTTTKVRDLEAANGNEITFMRSQASDGRSNYTTPADNYHWRWLATGTWAKLQPATGYNWIGEIRFKPSSNAAFGIMAQGGVTSISLASNEYTINFKDTMPDTNYAVLVSSRRMLSGGQGDEVTVRDLAFCKVRHLEGSDPATSTYMSVAIFR